MRITVTDLKRIGACKQSIRRFKSVFGTCAELNHFNADKAEQNRLALDDVMMLLFNKGHISHQQDSHWLSTVTGLKKVNSEEASVFISYATEGIQKARKQNP